MGRAGMGKLQKERGRKGMLYREDVTALVRTILGETLCPPCGTQRVTSVELTPEALELIHTAAARFTDHLFATALANRAPTSAVVSVHLACQVGVADQPTEAENLC